MYVLKAGFVLIMMKKLIKLTALSKLKSKSSINLINFINLVNYSSKTFSICILREPFINTWASLKCCSLYQLFASFTLVK